MRSLNYKTKGTCAKEIQITIDDNNIIKNLHFVRGCDGNAKGVSSLCLDRDIDEVIKRLEGITCDNKKTSCPDQLSKALKEFKWEK